MAVLNTARRTASTASGVCLAKMRFSFRKNSTHNRLLLLVATGEYALRYMRWLPLAVQKVQRRATALPKTALIPKTDNP